MQVRELKYGAGESTDSKQAMVSFSFDDGREDTYRVAYKIMKEYGLVGTIHVTTGWVDGSWATTDWPSAVNGAMTIEQVQECYTNGFEITSHGDRHFTDADDLRVSLKKLKQWGVIDTECLGFSSPNSELSVENQAAIKKIFNSHNIKYVRSGRSSKCYQLPMKIIYGLHLLTGSKLLFRIFNENNSINAPTFNDIFLLQSSVIKSNNSAKQVIGLLQKSICTKSWNILMLHSVLRPNDKGYGCDPWYWDAEEFRKLCQWLNMRAEKDISVVTIKDGIKKYSEGESIL